MGGFLQFRPLDLSESAFPKNNTNYLFLSWIVLVYYFIIPISKSEMVSK